MIENSGNIQDTCDSEKETLLLPRVSNMKMTFVNRLLAFGFLLTCCGTARCDYANHSEALGAGMDELQAKNYSESQAILDEALSLAKNDQERARTYSVLSIVQISQGEFAKARAQLDMISNLVNIDATTRALAFSQTGDIFIYEKKFDRARVEYEKALNVEGIPKSLARIAQSGIAQTYLFEGKFDTARAEFSKILLLKDSVPYVEVVVARSIGESYIAEAEFDKAREVLYTILKFKSDDLSPEVQGVILANQQSAQMDIAETYLLQKDYARAKQEYEKALAMGKLDPIRKAEIEKKLNIIEVASNKRSEK